MLEIPRNVTASIWKLLGGLFLALVAVAIATGAASTSDPAGGVVVAAIVAVFAALVIAGQAWILIRRPIGLRATEAGVWFGAGPVVAWRDVEAIYETTIPVERYGMSAKLGGITFALRRKRLVLRLPVYCWLSSISPGSVRVSTAAMLHHPGAVAAQLEQLRFAACGHEDGALPGASEPPAARIARR